MRFVNLFPAFSIQSWYHGNKSQHPFDTNKNHRSPSHETKVDRVPGIQMSNEAPVNFIEKNNGYFGSKDYPMMWFVNDHKYQSSPLEQALQPWNITKVYFSEPEDPISLGWFGLDSVEAIFDNHGVVDSFLINCVNSIGIGIPRDITNSLAILSKTCCFS